MLHARLSFREIPCDEYLRLRLRKSKTIRFNHREERYETESDSLIDFLEHISIPELLFPSKYADYLLPVTFLYYIGIMICYLASENDRKTEIYYFPSVIYTFGGLISGIFKVVEAYFFLAYVARSYFCITSHV